MSDWVDGVAAFAAVGSAVIAWSSRRDALRSANTSAISANAAEKSAVAAEKSAKEAESATKIYRAKLLAPHFDNVGYLWSFVLNIGQGTPEQYALGRGSALSLKALLSEDKQLTDTLDAVLLMFGNGPVPRISFLDQIDKALVVPETAAQAARDAFDVFEFKRREYLSIGQNT